MSSEIKLNERLLSAEESELIYWSLWNGAVSFAVFIAPQVVDEAAHRAAAIGLLEIEERRYVEHRQRNAEHLRELDYQPPEKNFIRARWMPERAVGNRIAISAFLGPWFDLKTQKYVEVACSPIGPYPRFETYAFADAFSSPVHFHKASTDIEAMFLKFGRVLFNDFKDIEVYEWSTDWSSYFDDGYEYWGAFCWTVYNPSKATLIGIAAVDTD